MILIQIDQLFASKPIKKIKAKDRYYNLVIYLPDSNFNAYLKSVRNLEFVV
jgi:hypothetical protein